MKTPRLTLIALLLVLAACTTLYRHHGYVPPEDALAQVVVGETTRDDLPALIGEPGAEGVLTGSGWYYVGSRWEQYGPRPAREIERQVVAISFTDDGRVANVERFGLEQGRVVALSRRVTDSGVVNIGLIRQLMGNIGNVTAGQILDD